eukprot:TRINITY_DN1229_c0_g1_i1.p1 TRINITY_DN1229_c0_g1~~TRINITY_DN1229_c0_g1_i1.p1  ORF type:complete len:189 (+),score=43.70 TRINITY_DN1229_c0_g1_i1:450-1016(+)
MVNIFLETNEWELKNVEFRLDAVPTFEYRKMDLFVLEFCFDNVKNMILGKQLQEDNYLLICKNYLNILWKSYSFNNDTFGDSDYFMDILQKLLEVPVVEETNLLEYVISTEKKLRNELFNEQDHEWNNELFNEQDHEWNNEFVVNVVYYFLYESTETNIDHEGAIKSLMDDVKSINDVNLSMSELRIE